MALGRGTDVFNCGISVAPVTDYRYYGTFHLSPQAGELKLNLQ